MKWITVIQKYNNLFNINEFKLNSKGPLFWMIKIQILEIRIELESPGKPKFQWNEID